MLGLIMGTAAKLGRDKITLITSPGISDLGAWLEQLIAESTGKLGKGIIPVDREELGAPEVYGKSTASSPTFGWKPRPTRRRTPRSPRSKKLGTL